jgi:hypothetical protein
VAVGCGAGQKSQGAYSVALGFNAGNTEQAEHSIIINASGKSLNASTAGLFVAIRNSSEMGNLTPLFYDSQSGEIMYSSLKKSNDCNCNCNCNNNNNNNNNQETITSTNITTTNTTAATSIAENILMEKIEMLQKKYEELEKSIHQFNYSVVAVSSENTVSDEIMKAKPHQTFVMVTNKTKARISMQYYNNDKIMEIGNESRENKNTSAANVSLPILITNILPP